MDHHQLFVFAAQRGLVAYLNLVFAPASYQSTIPLARFPLFQVGSGGATPLILSLSVLPLSHSLSMLFECGLCDSVLFLPWGGFKKRPVGWLSVLYVCLSACPSVKVIKRESN